MTLRVVRTEDPAGFLAATTDLLSLDPVLSTVVSGVTQRAVVEDEEGLPRGDHPRWWAWVEDADRVVGVAMRTAPFPPYPLFVLPMPVPAAHALAALLHETDEHPGGINGALPAAEELAREWVRLAGRGHVEVHQRTRLFELGEPVPPERPARGRLRQAARAEVDLVLEWSRAFGAEADAQAGREPEPGRTEHVTLQGVARQVARGQVWVWEDPDGEVAHLTVHGQPAYGVVRVGPVYTPPGHRGRGYASSAVALVAARCAAKGQRVCLFTDQANPTSNSDLPGDRLPPRGRHGQPPGPALRAGHERAGSTHSSLPEGSA